nr:poly-beta-1,6-N-acetyl-D-glucosamine N-deacetylase PgaB [Methylomarinum sp. Ch1-1]MDP4519213.1 poly-beta-1,6-N-acetyl-D-glucosamine N-deacetylase PgaB [Methylomarinum sp. Ch1-1]
MYLQAFADPDGDGNADALYFPNRHLPVRADLFNRVAWQLKTRAHVNVYAWLPVLSFHTSAPDDWWVQELRDGRAVASRNDYRRLSPFHPQAREFVNEIYQDLAKHAHFAGLLFHDDAFLTDTEDVSPAALRKTAGLSPKRKLAAKINALTGLTADLAESVRYYRPEIKTARNLYASIIMQPESQQWFAQSFANFMAYYDYVALMAMPYMEDAERPQEWLGGLIDNVARLHPAALKRTVFELQSVDWRSQEKIPQRELMQQMELLQRKNAMNFGYYPDDFLTNEPPLMMLKETMSLEIFPFGD